MSQYLSKSYLLIVTCMLISIAIISISTPAMANTQGASKDKITWYVTEWAPFTITRGKLKRKGINDKLIKLIHEYLPSYDVEWKNMNPSMLNRAFSKGENICQLDLFKTPEREKIAYFTTFPSVIDAPLRLFIKARDQDKIQLTMPVDIKQLFENKALKGAFIDGRSYNTTIDNAKANYQGKNVTTRESTKRLLKDFYRGKIDYVVEYSAVMSYFKSMLKSKSDILSMPIKGTEKFVLGYAACSKTLWGKTAIDAIDAVLKDQRHSDRYKQILEQWHDERSKKLIIDSYFYF